MAIILKHVEISGITIFERKLYIFYCYFVTKKIREFMYKEKRKHQKGRYYPFNLRRHQKQNMLLVDKGKPVIALLFQRIRGWIYAIYCALYILKRRCQRCPEFQ